MASVYVNLALLVAAAASGVLMAPAIYRFLSRIESGAKTAEQKAKDKALKAINKL